MGSCSSAPKNETDVQLDRDLKKSKHQEDAIHKLLLLGAGESGKSTFFKQMQLIYGKGYSQFDKKAFVSVIHRNVTSSMEELCKQSVQLSKLESQNNENFQLCAITNPTSIKSQLFFTEGKLQDIILTKEIANHVKQLWSDPGIQQTYKHRSRFQLNDNLAYFFDKVDQLAANDYLPNEEDILRVRVRTTGITEFEFIIDSNRFRMIDVGGQRNERKKWIHCFDNVTCVLFVADMSAYDQVLFEDDKVGRLEEALNLFENICNSRWFRQTSIILFLNKHDIFQEKIKMTPLSRVFKDYKGGHDANLGREYIEQEFLARNHYKKQIFCHATCATDTSNIRVVFNGVKEIVLRKALDCAGLLT